MWESVSVCLGGGFPPWGLAEEHCAVEVCVPLCVIQHGRTHQHQENAVCVGHLLVTDLQRTQMSLQTHMSWKESEVEVKADVCVICCSHEHTHKQNSHNRTLTNSHDHTLARSYNHTHTITRPHTQTELTQSHKEESGGRLRE